MRWSFKLFRVGGTDVRVHITFLLLLAFIAWVYHAQGGAQAAVQGVGFILALFGCVLLHEFGHVVAARAYGILTPDITLLPIGGVARLQRMPEKPSQELVVALAGPAVNVVIALAIYLGLSLGLREPLRLADFTRLDAPAVGMLGRLMAVNVWLVLFNLIPAFPMDGGRVLRALLAMRMDYVRATQVAAGIGQSLAFVFGFLGLFYNPFLILIAFFIYAGAGQEAAFTTMRRATRRLTLGDVMITDFRTLPDAATLDDAVEALLRTNQREFPIEDAAGQIVGLLGREQMIAALRSVGRDAPVGTVMQQGVPRLPADSSFERAMEAMNEAASPVLLVEGPDGAIVGMLTAENAGEAMMIQSATAFSPAGPLPHHHGPPPLPRPA